jgi:hypothetical protein
VFRCPPLIPYPCLSYHNYDNRIALTDGYFRWCAGLPKFYSCWSLSSFNSIRFR